MREHASAIASTGFAVLRPTGIEGDFLRYAVQCEELIGSIISRSTGVSYPAINAGDLMKLKIPVPDRPTQRSISTFLKRETAKIDELLSEQKRIVSLLAEKRQAVISRAVTQGIKPTPLQDSGIEWLGRVPAHWDIVAAKRAIPAGSGPSPVRCCNRNMLPGWTGHPEAEPSSGRLHRGSAGSWLPRH